jgi:tRNA(His) 5'-end guanylyltransferase
MSASNSESLSFRVLLDTPDFILKESIVEQCTGGDLIHARLLEGDSAVTQDIYWLINHVPLQTEIKYDKLLPAIPLPFSSDSKGYIMGPDISRKAWNELGDKLTKNERFYPIEATGDQWITLRLDGKAFSNTVKTLKSLGVFEQGYSHAFAECMRATTRALMSNQSFEGVVYAFTQSDEITLVIKPAPLERDTGKGSKFSAIKSMSDPAAPPSADTRAIKMVQSPHQFNGRSAKLISLSAAIASTAFRDELMRILLKRAMSEPSAMDTVQRVLAELKTLPTTVLDSRMAVYPTFRDAFELVLWRAYDCSVNGLCSVIDNCGRPGAKAISKLYGAQKLKWISEQGLFPAHPHQVYGTFMYREKALIPMVPGVIHAAAGEFERPEEVLRQRIVEVSIPVVHGVKVGSLQIPGVNC